MEAPDEGQTADPIQAKQDEIAYLEKRKERITHAIGENGFNRTVDGIMEVLKKEHIDMRPTVRKDLFEYVEGLINL